MNHLYFYVCLSALHRYTQTAQRCEGVLVYWKSMEPLTLSSVLFLITCNDSIHIISPKRRLEVCMIRADALHNCWLIHSFVARMCVCGYFTPLIAVFLKKKLQIKSIHWKSNYHCKTQSSRQRPALGGKPVFTQSSGAQPNFKISCYLDSFIRCHAHCVSSFPPAHWWAFNVQGRLYDYKANRYATNHCIALLQPSETWQGFPNDSL